MIRAFLLLLALALPVLAEEPEQARYTPVITARVVHGNPSPLYPYKVCIRYIEIFFDGVLYARVHTYDKRYCLDGRS